MTTRRSTPLRAGLLALALTAPLTPLAAQEQPPATEAALTVPAGDLRVAELAEQWTKATGTPVTVDPQAGQVVIHFGAQTQLGREVLRSVLGFNDVVVVEDAAGLAFHHRRNLATRLPVTGPVISGQEAPAGDQLLTAVHYVRHGAGAAIFATLRGLMTRDTNRVGNLLYVSGPEALVISDLAPQVRYYQQLIEKLDVAPPTTTVTLRVLELPRARWAALSAAARGAALAQALAGEAGVTELEAATLDLTGEAFVTQREHRLGDGARQVRVHVGRPSQPAGKEGATVATGGETAQLAMDVFMQSGPESLNRHVELQIPALRGVESTLVQAFAGREGDSPTQLVLVLTTRPRQ